MFTAEVPTIDVATLRTWLEQHRRVTVLDVRPTRDRTEWRIPESQHVDAYDALWADDPAALADVALPADAPVVTVCAAGRTSLIAARHLRARGLDAISLDGGMRAWSLAWNSAPVALPDVGPSAAQIVQVRRTGKGCLSYLVGADQQALVIDPSLAPKVYCELARERGWRISGVLETHIHADHLSRGRALAELCDAELYLPAQRRVSFDHRALDDGDTLTLGSTQITALRTPGHTPESTCYLLDQRALFSGDTLTLAGVGRPDLLGDTAGTPRAKTHLLYRSLQRILALDPTIQVLPCHAGEPIAFDGRPISAALDEIKRRLSALLADEDAFVEQILARIPETPANHMRIIALNEAGALPEEDPTELEAGANRCAVA
jgi:glyoxylase-like metal-dependent hydrolase (beta-lactamase superfamily II)/rhodanese-related sulfurtransferase